MSYNYPLKYRTFDQLLSEVKVDLPAYSQESFLEPQQLMKVARKCNKELGLRISRTKEALIEIEKGHAKLPDDFDVLNFALVCMEGHYVSGGGVQGTHIEERLVTPYQTTPATINTCDPPTVNCQVCNPNPCNCQPACSPTDICADAVYNPLEPYGNNCNKPRVYMNCKGQCYELVQIINPQTIIKYNKMIPIRILNNPVNVDCSCPNLHSVCPDQAWIKDGFIYTSTHTAKIYINYQGDMVDDDNNILVPDHELLNEYYEFAVKDRLLYNLVMNDEPVSQAKIQLTKEELRRARITAFTIVNTPNFSEMRKVWETNRKAQYARYFNMFKGDQFSHYGLSNIYR